MNNETGVIVSYCVKRASEESKYRYTGQEYDEETDLHNYKARFYDSMLMRFYSVDPAEEQASPYTYCANNPVMFTDPSGMVLNNTGNQKDYFDNLYLMEYPVKLDENKRIVYDPTRVTPTSITDDPLQSAVLEAIKSPDEIRLTSYSEGIGENLFGEEILIAGGSYSGNIKENGKKTYIAQQLVNKEGLEIISKLTGEDVINQTDFEIAEASIGIKLNPGQPPSIDRHQVAHEKTEKLLTNPKSVTVNFNRSGSKKDKKTIYIEYNYQGKSKTQIIKWVRKKK